MKIPVMALLISLIGIGGCSQFVQEPAPNDSTTRLLNEMKSVPSLVASTPAKADDRDSQLADLDRARQELASSTDELNRTKQQMAGLSGTVSERDQEIARLKGLVDQERLSKAENDLVKLLQPEISKGNVSVHQIGEQLTINLGSGHFFDSGKAELKPTGVDVIKRLGRVLKEFPEKQVQVDGYTDNVPIRGALKKTFPNNMELSKARAEHAVITLEHGGAPKGNLSSAGHADADPIADNKTETGRRKNRRVAIVVQ